VRRKTVGGLAACALLVGAGIFLAMQMKKKNEAGRQERAFWIS
jgi:hypothetical protein